MDDVREIALTRNMVALVDADDYERVVRMGRWCADPSHQTFYARKNLYTPGSRKLTPLLMHRFITGWEYVDHINGNGLDNRRSNLRQADHFQNMANKRRYRNNTSGFKGVTRNTGTGRPWRAAIRANNKRRHLGYYDTPELAARAYDTAAIALFGEFARLNFPQEKAA